MRKHCNKLLIWVLLSCTALAVRAEIIVSANDSKAVLIDGRIAVVADAAPDTVAVIRVHDGVATLAAEIEAPTGFSGPPYSIAITPDESLALLTAPRYADPAAAPDDSSDDTIHVLDLTTSPPRVTARVVAGKGAAGLSIAPDGKLALVANRRAGTVSVFAIEARALRKVATLKIAAPESGVAHVAISPDGSVALVTRSGDNTVSVLAIDGQTVTDTQREFGVGIAPYGVAFAPGGDIAVVANVAQGRGDDDTLSVIDMRSRPLRAVNTFSVGQTPETVAMSPDGKWCAVVLLNGSNKAPASPFYNPAGKLVVFRIEGTNLHRVSEAPLGAWPQGAAFAADSKMLLVGSMVERNLRVFHIDRAGALTDTGARIPLRGGNAALRAAPPAKH